MWKLKACGLITYIAFFIALIVIEIIGIVLIAGAVASYFGFSGIMWWAVAIVMFLLINAILNGLRG